jgi:bacteriocin-like protein
VYNEPRFDRLTDDDLDQVSGGMSCNNAMTAAKVYIALSSFYSSLGMSSAAAAYGGKAQGVLQGGCS